MSFMHCSRCGNVTSTFGCKSCSGCGAKMCKSCAEKNNYRCPDCGSELVEYLDD